MLEQVLKLLKLMKKKKITNQMRHCQGCIIKSRSDITQKKQLNAKIVKNQNLGGKISNRQNMFQKRYLKIYVKNMSQMKTLLNN